MALASQKFNGTVDSSSSIGVLYCKSGQRTEEDMFNNEHGSDRFDDFLELLGDKIELRGFAGYRGDLDGTIT